jgi:hypothetical protein
MTAPLALNTYLPMNLTAAGAPPHPALSPGEGEGGVSPGEGVQGFKARNSIWEKSLPKEKAFTFPAFLEISATGLAGQSFANPEARIRHPLPKKVAAPRGCRYVSKPRMA